MKTETVFSHFYYEYIRYSPDDYTARRYTDSAGRAVLVVPGTGTVSGNMYTLVIIDGTVDDRQTVKY